MTEQSQNTHKLNQFKNQLKNSMFVSPEEMEIFNQIPESYFEEIFYDNFNGNLSLATQILFEQYSNIDYSSVREELKKINNFDKSVMTLSHYLKSGKKIVFVTDIDNDGSLSQSILIELKKSLGEELSKNIDVVYTQVVNGNTERGITVDLIELWGNTNDINNNEDFLILTADNGINSRNEVEKIRSKFKNSKIIITDHHLPNEDVVQENKNTLIFNPKYKPTDFFKGKKNISGAHTLGVLCEGVLESLGIEADLKTTYTLEAVSNMLDYVPTDIRLKPLENHYIETFSSLGPLLNVNNSLSKLITDDYDVEDIKALNKVIKGFDQDEFIELIISIKEQNVIAQKLLYLKNEYDSTEEKEKKILSENEFYLAYLNAIARDDIGYTNINNNYIEQLRPFIYHFAAGTSSNSYETAMFEKMKDVFNVVRRTEKSMMKLLKINDDVIEIVENDYSTVMFPKNELIAKVFNRKFIAKTFNVANKGFLLLLNETKGNTWSGSFRGLHDASLLMKNKEEFTKRGLSVKFKGHERAAGFDISRKDGDITIEDIKFLSEYMNNEVSKIEVKAAENKKYILIDFENFNIVSEINAKVKALTNNFSSIKPLVKLNRSLFFTEEKTLKQISVGQMLKKEKYGYTVVKLDFHNNAIIVPTEIVRQLHSNNFKDYLEISNLAKGVFIANKVVPVKGLKKSNIVKLKSPSKERQEELSQYYEDNFHEKTFFKNLNREDLKKIPIFERQTEKEGSFAIVEELFISLIDKYDLDKYIILDTEANGLGKAPKLFNYGALEVNIKEGSGEILTEEEFLEIKKDPIRRKIFEKNLRNIKYDAETKTFIINREIEATMLSSLLKERDFKLTPEISALTGISQAMLNKFGANITDFDNMLVERYKGQKVVFQAHNASYDLGVLNANLPNFKMNIVDTNLVCDSAKFAKDHKLAYGDITISTVSSKFRRAFFFDDPFCDYTLSKIIKDKDDFVFPDVRGEYLLKCKDENITLIDLKKNLEHELGNKETLIKNIKKGRLPKNMIKYSVVSLLKYDNIKNLMLDNIDAAKKNINTPDFIPSEFDELFQEFCNKDNYNFEMTIEANFNSFVKRLKIDGRDEEKDMLFVGRKVPKLDVYGNHILTATGKHAMATEKTGNLSQLFIAGASKFIQENRDVHMKHVTVWEYSKVLEHLDPSTSIITQNQLKGLSYKTGLPEDRIKRITTDIFKYKREHKIDGEFFTPELHNNIDERGDAPLEAMVVFLRLSKQMGNLAEDIISDVIDDTVIKNVTKSIIENQINIIAQNSYSAKQLLSYGNRKDSEGILIQTPTVDAARDGESKYLKNRLLPQGTHIVTEKPLGNDISSEDIAKMEEKFNLIVALGLIKNSSLDFKVSKESYEELGKLNDWEEKAKIYGKLLENHKEKVDCIEKLVEASLVTSEEYEKELTSILGAITFSREQDEMKKYAQSIWSTLTEGLHKSPIRVSPNYYKNEHKDFYISLIDNFVDLNEKLNYTINHDVVKELKQKIDEYEPSEIPSIFEDIDTYKLKIAKFITTDRNASDLIHIAARQQSTSPIINESSKIYKCEKKPVEDLLSLENAGVQVAIAEAEATIEKEKAKLEAKLKKTPAKK